MTPGRFHAETFAAFLLQPGEELDLTLRDADGVVDTLWALARGDTNVNEQVSDISFPGLTDAQKPKELCVWLVRRGTDNTQRCRRTIKAGVKTWADGFGGEEFIDETDGLVSFRISHDGPRPIRIGKVVVKAPNMRAQLIHDLGGFNQWSDGTIK